MLNPREFIRRLMKFLVMMGILVLALLNTQKLETNEVLLVGSIVTITFVILDTMVPSIEIKKE
jgi:hypothetical protein